MSEVLTRLALILGAVAVTAVITLALRTRQRSPEKDVELPPGIYLFSSATCADCVIARDRLVGELGEVGFVEYSWEEEPALFTEMAIDVVPTTLVVRSDSTIERVAGDPVNLLRQRGP
ncbi:MAG: thioredoxin family protein [Acidimicrobiia bacterium]